jgi:hypothetical protein
MECGNATNKSIVFSEKISLWILCKKVYRREYNRNIMLIKYLLVGMYVLLLKIMKGI